MKAVFYASAKPREQFLAECFRHGVESAGHQFELRKTSDYGEDEHGNNGKNVHVLCISVTWNISQEI